MISLSKYRMILNASMRLSLLLLLFLIAGSAFGQSKEELQRQRDEINKQLSYTRKLIGEAEENKAMTSRELKLLQEQIRLRSRLLRSYEKEIAGIDQDIDRSESEIIALEAKIEAMKEEYASMIYQAYKSRRNHDELMYIFAASDFNQAFKRFQILREYAEYRKKQAKEIENTQLELQDQIAQLERDKESKVALAADKKKEADALEVDKRRSQEALNSLQAQQEELIAKQRSQEKEKKRLSDAIRKIIEEELAAEARKNKGAFALTPEGKIVSENFAKNKGQLPWPVLRGVITARFGTQPHESIPGITVQNNGIDISTEAGSAVISIFNGEVTSVFSIPGAGKTVIITHGAYKSVYSYLTNLNVGKGDTIEAGEKIGEVMDQKDSSFSHFEVWKTSSKGPQPQNPELWIKGR